MLPRSLPQILGLLALVGVGCVAYGVAIERRWYRLVRHRVAILPADGEGPETLTVLHLSDLHFVRGDEAKARFLASLPEADVTIVTGDFLAEPEAVERVGRGGAARARAAGLVVRARVERLLRAAPPELPRLLPQASEAAAGPKPGRAPDLVAQLTADGWQDLTNVRREIELDGLPIELLGLDDAHMRWHDLTVAPRRAPDRFGVAVMHSPDSAPEAAALGYELMVAGHTHGGQVCLPLARPVGGALVTNCSMPRRLVAGLIRMGGSVLHTSKGLGTSKYAPFRFACRPEATLLELRRIATLEAPRDVAQLGSAQRSGR